MWERVYRGLCGSWVMLRAVVGFLQFVVADGLGISYQGCFEASVDMFGKVVQDKRILVRKDLRSPSSGSAPEVILGMNVLREMSPKTGGLL